MGNVIADVIDNVILSKKTVRYESTILFHVKVFDLIYSAFPKV